ncbi:unnamed protein product [Nezara viridula]|uniref:Uncharacterized protein n=1 Tax=Nezara viridula TaxID=85310 RepID=A0A9P0H1C0_NEZVI|nr:unnamed protein product [Nezara viridula]
MKPLRPYETVPNNYNTNNHSFMKSVIRNIRE